MALSHVTKVYAITDLKITKMLTDPAGAPTTYAGSSVDVPGAKEMVIGGSVNAVELRGDNQLLDADAFLTDITVQIKHGKLSLDVLNILLGSTITDAGVTPNQTSKLEVAAADALNYFKIEGKSLNADTITGDVHFTIWKAKITDFPGMGLAEEAYQIPSFTTRAVPPIGTPGKWMTVLLNETAAVIP